MTYHGIQITCFYMIDWDNQYNPQVMADDDFYKVPDDPATNMSASQTRDLINITEWVAARVGGRPKRIEWYMQLEGHVLLHPIENYNFIKD